MCLEIAQIWPVIFPWIRAQGNKHSYQYSNEKYESGSVDKRDDFSDNVITDDGLLLLFLF